MKDVIFKNFCRKGTKDHTQATKYLKTVLANVLCKYFYAVAKFCDERPSIIAEKVQKWVNNVEKEKNVLAIAGRPSALSEEQRATSKI